MKLWGPVLTALFSHGGAQEEKAIEGDRAFAERQTVNFFAPISQVHSLVRNAPLPKKYIDGLRETERFADSVLSGEERTLSLSPEGYVSFIRNLTNFEETGAERATCNERYPTINGNCNHPEGGGKTMQAYARMAGESDYCDNRSSLKCPSTKVGELPNARQVSIFLKTNDPPVKNEERTHLMTSYGQFITHTAVQTPDVGGSSLFVNVI